MSIVALCFAMCSACSTGTTKQLLNNISGDCERHYNGAVRGGLLPGGGGFEGTVKIDCAPTSGVAPQTEKPEPTAGISSGQELALR